MFRRGIFDKGVLTPKEDKIPFASCFFANLDFLFPHTKQVDFNINLPFFALITLASLFSVFFYSLNNKFACFIN